MAKPRKEASTPEAPIVPQVGDKVRPGRSEMIYEISHVSHDGAEVKLHVPGTNLERFRVRTDTLTFVERKPPARTSNPFTNAEPTFDAAAVLERIRSVERENIQRLEGDIALLTKYLKTQDAPKSVIGIIEGLSSETASSWKNAIERVVELLED